MSARFVLLAVFLVGFFALPASSAALGGAADTLYLHRNLEEAVNFLSTDAADPAGDATAAGYNILGLLLSNPDGSPTYFWEMSSRGAFDGATENLALDGDIQVVLFLRCMVSLPVAGTLTDGPCAGSVGVQLLQGSTIVFEGSQEVTSEGGYTELLFEGPSLVEALDHTAEELRLVVVAEILAAGATLSTDEATGHSRINLPLNVGPASPPLNVTQLDNSVRAEGQGSAGVVELEPVDEIDLRYSGTWTGNVSLLAVQANGANQTIPLPASQDGMVDTTVEGVASLSLVFEAFSGSIELEQRLPTANTTSASTSSASTTSTNASTSSSSSSQSADPDDKDTPIGLIVPVLGVLVAVLRRR